MLGLFVRDAYELFVRTDDDSRSDDDLLYLVIVKFIRILVYLSCVFILYGEFSRLAHLRAAQRLGRL